MTMIIAHRGGKALGSENTISSMKLSLKKGANGVEFDVRNCFTGESVVMHDASLDRTTNRIGNVDHLSLEEIQQCDAGDGNPPPSLIDVLNGLNPTTATLFIDLKHPKAAMQTATVCDHFIREKGYGYGQIVIISAFHQLLVQIHQKFPKLQTGAVVRHTLDGMAACGEYTNSRYVLPDIDITNEAFVHDAHKRGLKIVSWTCDSEEQKEKALSLKLDGIITSDPTLYIKG